MNKEKDSKGKYSIKVDIKQVNPKGMICDKDLEIIKEGQMKVFYDSEDNQKGVYCSKHWDK
ncbi:protein of unknown function [endosymbiont DhMRE of Dentiscutata heterogama]|uniref:hypothetical protein n=1 Tax=endosymbiont DhMRE of Dentiscutata heterogama TaxID=1609546 RepID=UPI000629DA21|nr:hypothetical protein [endosymbiont DhMRE of Dentiscutata heterogama]CFW93388.1 protein of unknown function [endosymbiont DhMRE of Dentiscutata heterogama]